MKLLRFLDAFADLTSLDKDESEHEQAFMSMIDNGGPYSRKTLGENEIIKLSFGMEPVPLFTSLHHVVCSLATGQKCRNSEPRTSVPSLFDKFPRPTLLCRSLLSLRVCSINALNKRSVIALKENYTHVASGTRCMQH